MNQTSHQQSTAGSWHIEGINIPTLVFTDRVSLIQVARRGLPGEVLKQAVGILGHREVFVRLLETTGGNLSRFYRRKALSPSQSEGNPRHTVCLCPGCIGLRRYRQGG